MYVATKASGYVIETPSTKEYVGDVVRTRATKESSVVKSPPTDINSFKEQSGIYIHK